MIVPLGSYILASWEHGFFAELTLQPGKNYLDWELGSCSIVGKVTDAQNGEPLLGFSVYLTSMPSSEASPVMREVLARSPERTQSLQSSGAQGEFQYKSLAPGLYQLMVIADGYASFSQKIQLSDKFTKKIVDVFMVVGAEIQLTVEADGKTVDSPVFLARNLATGEGVIQSFYTSLLDRKLSGYTPGNYLLAAVADGYRVAFQNIELKAGELTEVKLELPKAKQFTFVITNEQGFSLGDVTIQLKLQSAGSSNVIADILAPLLDTQKKSAVTTDPFGNIAVSALPDGEYELSAWKKNYQAHQQALTIYGDGDQEVRIVLKKK